MMETEEEAATASTSCCPSSPSTRPTSPASSTSTAPTTPTEPRQEELTSSEAGAETVDSSTTSTTPEVRERSDEEETMGEVDEVMRKLAECSLCLKVRRANVVLMCRDSHNLCEFCFDKLKKKVCPQTECKVSFDSPPRRNRTAEEIVRRGSVRFDCRHACGKRANLKELESHERVCPDRPEVCGFKACGEVMKASEVPAHNAQLHVPCVYRSKGCGQVDGREAVTAHAARCTYRQVPCPSALCQRLTEERLVLDHMNVTHPDVRVLRSEVGVFETTWRFRAADPDGNAGWHPFVLHFAKKVFFVSLSREGVDYACWISMKAPREKARLRDAKLKIKQGNKSYSASGKVFSLDLGREEVLGQEEEGVVLKITKNQMWEILENDGEAFKKVTVAVKIGFGPVVSPVASAAGRRSLSELKAELPAAATAAADFVGDKCTKLRRSLQGRVSIGK